MSQYEEARAQARARAAEARRIEEERVAKVAAFKSNVRSFVGTVRQMLEAEAASCNADGIRATVGERSSAEKEAVYIQFATPFGVYRSVEFAVVVSADGKAEARAGAGAIAGTGIDPSMGSWPLGDFNDPEALDKLSSALRKLWDKYYFHNA